MFKIFLLVALLKLLMNTRKPLLCAGLYAGLSFVFAILIGPGLISAVINGVISFALAAVYFGLLNRFDDGFAYWSIMVVGLLIGLV